MKLSLQKGKIEDVTADAVVIGVFEDSYSVFKKLVKGADSLIKKKIFTGEFLQIYGSGSDKIKSDRVLFVGLGKRGEFDLEKLRKAAGVTAKALQANNYKKIATDLVEVNVAGSSDEDIVTAVSEAIVMGCYRFTKYKTVDKEKINFLQEVVLVRGSVKKLEEAVKKGEILGNGSNLVKDLVGMPAMDLRPKDLANIAKDVGKLKNVSVKVYDLKGIKKLGLEALQAVNYGSAHEPRFIIMEYKGSSEKPIALVGKGITFDSGGINIKPARYMEEMKMDMGGAAVVIGTIKTLAELKAKVHVYGVIASTENMTGGNAYKPGDVIRAYNKKTIEILNTDAEGRVVLSDALSYTEAKLKPKAIIDFATLTGAVMVALGRDAAGVIGDQEMIKKLKKSGDRVYERVWELPFYDEYKEYVKSEIADVKNLGGPNGDAGAITAAAFLATFIDKTPWVHVDIAGTAWLDKDRGYVPKGPSGYGVRLMVEFLTK